MWDATRRPGNCHQPQISQAAIASGDFPLALKHVNFNRGLIVDDSRKSETVTQRNGRVSFDNFGEQAAARLEAETQWQHIKQHNVLDIARQYAALNRSSHRYNFVGINFG